MGELKKLRIAGTENTVTPYTAADDTVVIANHTIKVNTNKIATKTDLDGKVDKETGKGLSTNDFTTAEKNKLAGIEAQANKTVVDAALSTTSENPVQNKVIKQALDNMDAGDIAYDDTETYDDGTVGDALNDYKADINNKIDKPQTAGTSGQVLTSDGQGGQTWETPADCDVTDVQINGTSVVSQSVANIPLANADSYGLIKLGQGFLTNNTTGKTSVDWASADNAKAGASQAKAINPYQQHRAAFYGLSKAAGVDMASSSNAVGTYTDDAKVAIQKMLGIYEAPWELIREGTFTNETEANYNITVDGNGQAFELTDIRMTFWLPTQNVASAIGGSGRVDFYVGSTNIASVYMGDYSQAAGANPRVAHCFLEQKDGMIFCYVARVTESGNPNTLTTQSNMQSISAVNPFHLSGTVQSIDKIVVRSITGSGSFRLYGKRKWS